jgi:hypothetical protein
MNHHALCAACTVACRVIARGIAYLVVRRYVGECLTHQAAPSVFGARIAPLIITSVIRRHSQGTAVAHIARLAVRK